MKSNVTGKQCKRRTGNKTIMERFISFLPPNYKEESMIDSCWNWKGGITTNKYGCIDYNGKNFASHRMSYILFKGPIKPGLIIMHTCDNPQCVNPKHLIMGTQADNMKDMIKKGRQRKRKRRHYGLTIAKIIDIVNQNK